MPNTDNNTLHILLGYPTIQFIYSSPIASTSASSLDGSPPTVPSTIHPRTVRPRPTPPQPGPAAPLSLSLIYLLIRASLPLEALEEFLSISGRPSPPHALPFSDPLDAQFRNSKTHTYCSTVQNFERDRCSSGQFSHCRERVMCFRQLPRSQFRPCAGVLRLGVPSFVRTTRLT